MKNHPHPANVDRRLLGSKSGKLFPFALALGISLALWPASARAAGLPPVSSGTLLVHLKADAGITTESSESPNVTAWTDQANSYAFNADVGAASRYYPTLITNAGVVLVHFATNSILSSSSMIELFPTANSGLTIFTAFATTDNAAQRYLLNHAVNPPVASGYTLTLELGVNAGARGAGNYGLHRGGSCTTFAPNYTISNNVFYVMSTVIKSNGYAPDNVEIYQNGAAQTLGVYWGSGNPQYPGWLSAGHYATGPQTLCVGGRFNAVNSAMDAFHRGDIGEVVIYQGVLSVQDRAAVEAYLGSKYSVNVAPPPALCLTAQPQTLAVTNGQAAAFAVAAQSANGQTISYQWQKNGSDIANATSDSYSIAAASSADAGSYQCVVSIPVTNLTSAAAQLRLYTDAPLPAVASGTVLLRLRADAGVTSSGSDMTSWLDQAGSFQFDATPNPFLWRFYPTLAIGLTGNKVIHFQGAHEVSCAAVQLFTETNSPLTIFTAFSVRDNSSQRYLFNSKVPRVSRQFTEMSVGVSPGTTANGLGNYGVHRAGSGASVAAPNTIGNNQFYVTTMVVKSNNPAPNNIALYRNGTALQVGGFPASNPSAPYTEIGWLSPGHYQTGAYPLYLGVAADSSQPGFSPYGALVGDIGEVIIYQGQLSDSDRVLVENYLGAKYGVLPELHITSQPQSFAAINGGSAAFSVTAVATSGGPVTYQWQKNGVNIASANSATFAIPSVGPTDAGNYQVVVSTPSTNIISDTAQLRVSSNPNPPTVSSGNLLVHLRADAGVTSDATGVTTWLDQSTNAFVFNAQVNETNAQPIAANGLTGNPVIRFNAANNNLLCSVPVQFFPNNNSPLTIFTASSVLDNSVQRYLVNLRVPRTNTTYFDEMSVGVDAGNRGAGNFGVHRAGGDSTFAPAGTIANNQFYITTLMVKSTGNAPGNIAIFNNGASLPVAGFLRNATDQPQDLGWLSAGHYPSGSYELRVGVSADARLTTGVGSVFGCWWGDIGEVLIYQGELTDSDRAAVETFLARKYGVIIPQLQIGLSGGNVVLSYPFTVAAYVLESTPSLTPPVTWSPVVSAPVLTGDQYSVTNPATGQMYYRLQR